MYRRVEMKPGTFGPTITTWKVVVICKQFVYFSRVVICIITISFTFMYVRTPRNVYTLAIRPRILFAIAGFAVGAGRLTALLLSLLHLGHRLFHLLALGGEAHES